MMPGEPTPRDTAPAADAMPEPVPIRRPEFRWYHKMSAVLFATFCLEIGCFLLIFPWTEYWDSNYFSGLHSGIPRILGQHVCAGRAERNRCNQSLHRAGRDDPAAPLLEARVDSGVR